MMQNTLRDLQSFGLHIPKEFIVFTIDSRTTLLQIRTRSVFYKKKFQALIARIQQSLAEANLSVFSNLAYIDQKSLPDGSRYHADILSKTKKQDATEDSIMQDYRDLHHMGWIEQVPPSQWSWVQKEYGLPAMEDSCLVQELGVNPDFLDQVKDFLDKPVDPDTLGQVPPTVSNLQTHITKQESPNSNSPDNNPTLLGSPEVPTDTSDHSTPAEAPTGATASAPAGTPPETIELRACWEDQVGRLINRKMLHGLGPKSVISILEKVTFYLKKLRWIAGLPPQKKGRLRESIKKDYLKNITTYSAWGHPTSVTNYSVG